MATPTRVRRASSALPGIDESTLTPEERETWRMPITRTPFDGREVDDREVDDTPETPEDRIIGMLATVDAGAHVRVKLYRKVEGGRREWCRDYDPSEFEDSGFEGVRREWGPGDYQVILHGPIASGKGGKPGRGIMTSAEVRIAAPTTSGPVNTYPAQGGTSDLARVIESIQASNRDFQQQVMAALTQRPDPRAEMAQTLQMMAMMKEVFAPPAAPVIAPAPQSSISEIVNAIKELRGAAELVNPGGAKDEGESLMALAPQVLGIIGSAMGNRAPQAPQALPQPNPTPALAHRPVAQAHPTPQPLPPIEESMLPVNTNPAPSTSTDTPAGEADAVKMIREAVAPLLDMAVANAPIEDGVDYLAEHLTDELDEAIENPQWWLLFVNFVPEAIPHRAWITAVRDAYLALPLEDVTPQETGTSAAEIPVTNDASQNPGA